MEMMMDHYIRKLQVPHCLILQFNDIFKFLGIKDISTLVATQKKRAVLTLTKLFRSLF